MSALMLLCSQVDDGCSPDSGVLVPASPKIDATIESLRDIRIKLFLRIRASLPFLPQRGEACAIQTTCLHTKDPDVELKVQITATNDL
jgi:hypothetical protein